MVDDASAEGNVDLENIERLRYANSRQYSQKYFRLLTVVFLLIILKQVILEEAKDTIILLLHSAVIGVILISLSFYKYNDVAVRVLPLFIALLSFMGHSKIIFGADINSSRIGLSDKSPYESLEFHSEANSKLSAAQTSTLS